MTTIAGWTELDDRAVKYARALAMDAVQKVGNGHPGTAMALALLPITSFSATSFMIHLIHSGLVAIDLFSRADTPPLLYIHNSFTAVTALRWKICNLSEHGIL